MDVGLTDISNTLISWSTKVRLPDPVKVEEALSWDSQQPAALFQDGEPREK